MVGHTRADHSRQAARAQPKGSHDLPCANLRQKAHKIIVFWDSCLSHSNDWPYFSVSNPYIEAISRTSLHFSASNPCRGAFSRTTLCFSATNPCRGPFSRIGLAFSASSHCSNPCRRIAQFFCEDCCFYTKMLFLSRELESSQKKESFLLRGSVRQLTAMRLPPTAKRLPPTAERIHILKGTSTFLQRSFLLPTPALFTHKSASANPLGFVRAG